MGQFDTTTSTGFDTSSSLGSSGSSSGAGIETAVFILVLLALGALALYLWRHRQYLHKRQLVGAKALKVILPKLPPDETDRRDPKEILGVMESVFAGIHHFYETNIWRAFWHGQPTFSFELTARAGEIFFFVVSPARYLDQVERVIHSQYPNAHIEPTKEHDIFLEKGGENAVGALKLQRATIFPIKTYKYLENDPLNGLTNSLSKVAQGRAAIQLLVQPTNQNWQHRIENALQNVQQGKTFNAGEGVLQKVGGIAKDVGQIAMQGQSEQDAKSNEAQNTTAGNVRLTALQEQQAKLLVEKGSKVGLKAQLRVIARLDSQIAAKNQVQTMLSAFAQFNAPESNGFKVTSLDASPLLVDYIIRSFSRRQPTLILTTEELTSLFHFPNRIIDTPNIHWLGARKLPPPSNLPTSGVLLGYSNYRGAETPIYYSYPDRTRHMYMLGKSGSGKTNLFQNMIVQDIRAGHGVCYMDPNGDAVEWILRHIPKERAEDVILFNPSDTARPVGLNLLEYDPQYPEQKTMVINEMLSIFDKLYDLKTTGGPMFEQYMRNAMLLVMDHPESGNTLMEISKVLADESYRKMKLSHSQNQVVIDFWTKEAEKAGGEAALANMVPYITSKLTQFTANDIMRPIIGQQQSAFNFREAMDSRKILLVTLPKGLLGDLNAQLLGMIISGKIQIAAFSRQSQPEAERTPFYLYVDEFQNFTSKTFATILSEARKYQLSLNITNQYIAQLDDDTRDAVFGNVGTLLTWRIGAQDAEFLTKEFDPLEIDDFVNTEKFNFYIKLLIEGGTSRPFNALSYPPDPHENAAIGEAIRQLSRLKFGRSRELIESEIRLRAQSVV